MQVPLLLDNPNEHLKRILVWSVDGAQNALQRDSMLHIVASRVNKRLAGGCLVDPS